MIWKPIETVQCEKNKNGGSSIEDVINVICERGYWKTTRD
jgi:hypothetical protein